METTFVIIPWAASLLFLGMTALWAIQLRTGDAGLADLGWSLGVGVTGVLLCLDGSGYLPRRLLAATLLAVWSLRLSWYLLVDRILPLGEDSRYAGLRRSWSPGAQPRFFAYFQLQVIFILAFALPFLAISNGAPLSLTLWDAAGLLVGCVALAGARLADRQLAAFRADPANNGKTLATGLWRYSRHPNYFFEWLFWWAFVLIGVQESQWWMTLVPPALLFVLLRYVTGIPHAEKRALATRAEYARYQQTTSAFVPWFPRKA